MMNTETMEIRRAADDEPHAQPLWLSLLASAAELAGIPNRGGRVRVSRRALPYIGALFVLTGGAALLQLTPLAPLPAGWTDELAGIAAGLAGATVVISGLAYLRARRG